MVVKQDVINLFNNIQEQDLEECYALSGVKDINSLIEYVYDTVKTLDYCEPVYKNNKICAIIGYKKHTLKEQDYVSLTALTTKEIINHKIEYFKHAIKFVNKAKKVCSKLLFCTLASYKEALSMNKRLGFKHYRDIEINGRKFEIDMLGV